VLTTPLPYTLYITQKLGKKGLLSDCGLHGQPWRLNHF
jgi:hypothetical protein